MPNKFVFKINPNSKKPTPYPAHLAPEAQEGLAPAAPALLQTPAWNLGLDFNLEEFLKGKTHKAISLQKFLEIR
ncbi:MAG: hypothetical protein WCK49_08480 [Myxococcaceae bacterium]